MSLEGWKRPWEISEMVENIFGNGKNAYNQHVLLSPHCSEELSFNSLPNIKSLDWLKLKAFADNKFNVAKMVIHPSVCLSVCTNLTRKIYIFLLLLN